MFLTHEDPNAKVKGYRDPLGAQPIWAKFGRHLVTNLTTQTTSVRGFTTLLLGRYFGHELIAKDILPRERFLDAFLCMEQIGAYVRHVCFDIEGGIRGIERVKKNIAESPRVPIGATSTAMILSDQKVYGLWGLYSVSARVSGLIPETQDGVEPIAREFIEAQYLGFLGPVRTKLDRLLSKGGKLDITAPDDLVGKLKPVLAEELTSAEREFYGRYLADGHGVEGSAQGVQARFRRMLDEQLAPDEVICRETLCRIRDACDDQNSDISRRLDRIICLEAVLAVADALFQFVLTRHRQPISVVAAEVRDCWGRSVPNINNATLVDLLPEVQEAQSPEVTKSLQNCGGALEAGDYEAAIRTVCTWNAQVMEQRKSAAWVTINTGNEVDVRYNGAEHRLPNGDELAEIWRNGYFINSLLSITRQLQGAA